MSSNGQGLLKIYYQARSFLLSKGRYIDIIVEQLKIVDKICDKVI